MLADEKLSEQDRLILQRLNERCSDITKARVFALGFQQLLFTKDKNALNLDVMAFRSASDRATWTLEGERIERRNILV